MYVVARNFNNQTMQPKPPVTLRQATHALSELCYSLQYSQENRISFQFNHCLGPAPPLAGILRSVPSLQIPAR
jgi:hypothetical protein